MQVVMLRKTGHRAGAYDLGRPGALLILGLTIVLSFAVSIYGGYRWGVAHTQPHADEISLSINNQLQNQQELVEGYQLT